LFIGDESVKETLIPTFADKAKWIIKKIPRGKVVTYGQVAALAGNPLGARQVAWVLHSSSRKDRLPWHRVINIFGRISLAPGHGRETQKALLIKEGLRFSRDGSIDLNRYRWTPRRVLSGWQNAGLSSALKSVRPKIAKVSHISLDSS
jgi:methylated-DNA-protein-cysteine methyltransferase related protein